MQFEVNKCYIFHLFFLYRPSDYRVTLRQGVYRQFVSLGDEPSETHDQDFYFSTEHLWL
jgi:hypothetical protein